MKWIANIKKIGKKVVDNKDGMVILFGEGANKDLEDVSVIQKFSTETPVSGFVLKKAIQSMLMVKPMLQTMLVRW